MHPLLKSALIFLGAGVGANARYWLGGLVSRRVGPDLPWGTFAVNVSGSLLIGFVMGLALSRQFLLVTGMLGGYTTFSTFSYETLNLVNQRLYLAAAGNAMGSVAAGLGACWLGLVAARAIAAT